MGGNLQRVGYNNLMNGRNLPDLPQPLTAREQEVLTCINAGLTNRQIAERLTIAMSTVKWYVRQIYNKLDVDNRSEAIARARDLGLVLAEAQENRIKNNLHAAATPFVGREEELDRLNKFIGDPQVRLITIVGPGGMGKTRLALEAARKQVAAQTDFPDGIFFVALAAIETAVEIISTVAATIDFQFQGSGDEEQQLFNYLRQKKMLLVMDNFEHILDGRMLLAEINKQAVGVKLLVTSRERLQLRGEQLFSLQGLSFGQSRDSEEEFLIDNTAVQLFLNICHQTFPDFKLLPGDAEQLQRICRLVEGMPLGLELAASWVGVLPLSVIASEIEQSMQLLTSQHHDMPRRHRSMQASLDASWQRLNFEQKLTFQDLTIFYGGFTRAAALDVAGVTLPFLITLTNKSWLSYDRQSDRYNIHELLRQYGAEKFNLDNARKQKAQCRHSTYFCGYLKARETDWHGTRQKEVSLEIRDEIDNIQVAWRWAAEQGDKFLLAQGLQSLCRFYLWEGRLKDGQRMCNLADTSLSRILSEQPSSDGYIRTLLSQVLVWKARFTSGVAQKEKILERGQLLLDQATIGGRDIRAEQALILLAKGEVTSSRDLEEAKYFSNQALALFQELDDFWGQAQAFFGLGYCCLFQGFYNQAYDLLQNGLEIRLQLGDIQEIANTNLTLSIIARHQGNFEEAELLNRKSLEFYRQLNNQFRESQCLGTLTYNLSWAGKYSAAEEAVRRAIELDRNLGLFPKPFSQNSLAKVCIHLGRYNEAFTIVSRCLDIANQRGLLMEIGWASMFMGDIFFVEGNLDLAKKCLLKSISVLAEMQHIYQAIPQAILSYVYRVQGKSDLARENLLSAIGAGIKTHSIAPMMNCLPIAALTYVDDGDPLRAIELYGLAQQFSYIKNSRWFADVACRELDIVYASLPLDEAEAAVARGREMDVWATAVSLLNELNGRCQKN